MSELQIILSDVTADIEAAFAPQGRGKSLTSLSMFDTIASAATGAIRSAADALKTEGRANIAAAGFSRRWSNAWRVNVYPARGNSVEAAVWAFHKIPYSQIFETGGTIFPKQGLLWLPLGTAPKVGRRRATPANLTAAGVKLFTMKRFDGGKPLLGTSVRLSAAQAGQSNLALSLAKLRKGTAGKRGTVRAVPLFVGLSSANIKKRFDLSRVAESIRNKLGSLYFQALHGPNVE